MGAPGHLFLSRYRHRFAFLLQTQSGLDKQIPFLDPLKLSETLRCAISHLPSIGPPDKYAFNPILSQRGEN